MPVRTPSYRLTVLHGPTVFIVTLYPNPFADVEQTLSRAAAEITPVLAAAEGPAFRINDMSLFDRADLFASGIFSQMMIGLATETRGWPGSSSDPRLSTCFVGRGEVARMMVEALRQEQFGQWDLPLYDTVEGALNAVRLKAQTQPQGWRPPRAS